MAASLAALVLLLASVLGPWESAFQATKWSQHSGAGLAYSCYVGNDGNLMQCATIVGEAGDVVEAGEQEGSEAWSDAREGVLGRDLDKDNSAVPPFQGCAANIYQRGENHQDSGKLGPGGEPLAREHFFNLSSAPELYARRRCMLRDSRRSARHT